MSTSAEAAVAANGGEVRDVDHDRKVDKRDESFHSTILHDLGEVNRLIQNIIANAHTEAQKAENSGSGAKRSGQGRGGAPPAQRRAVAHDLKKEELDGVRRASAFSAGFFGVLRHGRGSCS